MYKKCQLKIIQQYGFLPKNNLYVVSDEPLKIGDWYYSIMNSIKEIYQCDSQNTLDYLNEFEKGYKKIIASTNMSLFNYVPKIPSYIIEAYFNNSIKYTNILVKYNNDEIIVDSDNYITIVYEKELPTCKELYTREEVINILKKLNVDENQICNFL